MKKGERKWEDEEMVKVFFRIFTFIFNDWMQCGNAADVSRKDNWNS